MFGTRRDGQERAVKLIAGQKAYRWAGSLTPTATHDRPEQLYARPARSIRRCRRPAYKGFVSAFRIEMLAEAGPGGAVSHPGAPPPVGNDSSSSFSLRNNAAAAPHMHLISRSRPFVRGRRGVEESERNHASRRSVAANLRANAWPGDPRWTLNWRPVSSRRRLGVAFQRCELIGAYRL